MSRQSSLIGSPAATSVTSSTTRGMSMRLRCALVALLHVAARLSFHARTATLRLQASWRRAGDLARAFAPLKALPEPA